LEISIIDKKEKGMGKNILYIAFYYPPVSGDNTPGVHRTVRLLRYLKAAESHVLTVRLSCYPDYMDLDSKISLPVKDEIIHRSGTLNLFNVFLKIRFLFRNFLSRFKINRESKHFNEDGRNLIGDKSKGLGQRIKDFLSDFINYPDPASPWLIPAIYHGVKIIRKHQIDIIIATGMPWTSLIISYFLKLFTGKQLVVDFRDPWVDNPFHDKWLFEKYLDRMWEAMVIHKADLVIANTGALREEMVKRHKILKNKIMVLPNGYDVSDFRNIPEISPPKDKLIVTHAGALYLKRDPASFLKAIEVIKRQHSGSSPFIQFYQIGLINLHYDFQEYCRNKGIIEYVIHPGQMDHKDCLGYLAMSDVLLLIQPSTKTQIPSKLYEYIYLDKPIIAITEKDGALARLIAEYNFGAVFRPDEYEKIAEFLQILAEKKKKNGNITVKYSHKKIFDARYSISKFEDRLNDM